MVRRLEKNCVANYEMVCWGECVAIFTCVFSSANRTACSNLFLLWEIFGGYVGLQMFRLFVDDLLRGRMPAESLGFEPSHAVCTWG